MKAKELRVGNWVCIGIENYCLGYNSLIDALDTEKESNTCYFDPIPLTEEWLLKFGFEFRESSTFTEWYIGENEITHDWLFSIIWLDKPELISAPNAPFYRNGRHTIYYVHQLQNLYFALTGEELK